MDDGWFKAYFKLKYLKVVKATVCSEMSSSSPRATVKVSYINLTQSMYATTYCRHHHHRSIASESIRLNNDIKCFSALELMLFNTRHLEHKNTRLSAMQEQRAKHLALIENK